ncbi:AGE family epimerase/isomerase [Fimbriiglobus ruber]|uniref:N-acylglucosamine 2-epimerase n=1 Tax=Fimbriiglobus ruber TaxID=1908690 RepID=A0A225DN61_9BACT|nr:AGE family epimerase/isomerase [Fimbriiglobus ruber]OWK37617.1 N-acylglucosamine 2-epimerase [Fimbriiglobus ruber]
MTPDLTTPDGRTALAAVYRETLLGDVIPFWLRHGLDSQHGGYLTALARDGRVIDTDKSVWFQGRGAWTFATLYNTAGREPRWLDAAKTGIEFLRRHGTASNGKMYFTVTRDGRPLRMRRYVYSESFASIANAAYARAAADGRAAGDAVRHFETYLQYSFAPGKIPPKVSPETRPTVGIGSFMIGLATAQELRENLGDVTARGRTCTEWIDWFIDRIERLFVRPELQVVLETAGPNGEILDHFDGRLLNPGHTLEAAWFIMHEGKFRRDRRLIQLGLTMLDWMWDRGWDEEYGGLYYFRDLLGLPVQEYWHDMKFWWPHCEAIIATQLAWSLTGDARYARWHRQVHDWSFRHFADREFGEWYGYLHRDGRVSVTLKGNMWKGPFHLPRMLWYCWRLLDQHSEPAGPPC